MRLSHDSFSMKRYVLFLFVLFPLFAYSTECKIRARVTELPPDYYQVERGKWQGTQVAFARALFKEANCRVRYYEIPWKRALIELERGYIDVIMNLSKFPEREAYAYFIGPTAMENTGIATSKTMATDIRTLNDIYTLPGKLAMVKGTYFGSEFEDKLTSDKLLSDKIEIITKHIAFPRLVELDRIGGFLTEKNMLAWRIENDAEYSHLKLHPITLSQSPVYFGFSKASVKKSTIENIQRAYEVLSAKGVFLNSH